MNIGVTIVIIVTRMVHYTSCPTPACTHNILLINMLYDKYTSVMEQKSKSKNPNDRFASTIAKAIRSISRYPLPIVDEYTVKLLDGVGDFMAKMITSMIKEVYSEVVNEDGTTGVPQYLLQFSLAPKATSPKKKQRTEHMSMNSTSSSKSTSTSLSIVTSSKSGTSASFTTMTQTTLKSSLVISSKGNESSDNGVDGDNDDDIDVAKNDHTANEDRTVSLAKTKSKRKALPKHRSGSYALLIALYVHACNPGKDRVYLYEDELKELAQPYCDSSMVKENNENGTMPGGAFNRSKHYTAFNSKKTLLNNGWLTQCGRPLKYQITDEGIRIAKQLLQSKPIHNLPQYVNADSTPSSSVLDNDDIEINGGIDTSCTVDDDAAESDVDTLYDNEVIEICVDDDDDDHMNIDDVTTKGGAAGRALRDTLVDKPTTTNTIATVTSSCSFHITPYDVICLIDKRERGHHKDHDRSAICDELNKQGIMAERRVLQCGDVMFIARHTETKREYVLDCIIERKKITDMWASIKDGRYAEQRTRLYGCGLKRVIYLIEGNIQHLELLAGEERAVEAVESAVASLTAAYQFNVLYTTDIRHTMRTLVLLAKQLYHQFTKEGLPKFPPVHDDDTNTNASGILRSNSTLLNSSSSNSASLGRAASSISTTKPMTTRQELKPREYRDFAAQAEKDGNMKVGDLFTLQLRQIKGISVDRAIAIRCIYPTGRHLYDAYAACRSLSEEENMLSNVSASVTEKKVGNAISKRVQNFFRLGDYHSAADNQDDND